MFNRQRVQRCTALVGQYLCRIIGLIELICREERRCIQSRWNAQVNLNEMLERVKESG